MDEAELVRKLITHSHLSVPERAHLPLGVARFSVIAAQAAEVLRSDGWLPSGPIPENAFEGAVLELREGTYIVHECHEVSIGKFQPVPPRSYTQLAPAVRSWLKIHHGNAIDGIPIAWDG